MTVEFEKLKGDPLAFIQQIGGVELQPWQKEFFERLNGKEKFEECECGGSFEFAKYNGCDPIFKCWICGVKRNMSEKAVALREKIDRKIRHERGSE